MNANVKKFGFATIVASGIVGAFLGIGAPAQAVAGPALGQFSAGVDHRDWLGQYGPNAPVVLPNGDVHPSH
jgi:hypothetical protein